MLIISRDISQIFMIGDDIKIKIVGINGTVAHIGIEAPRIIPVHRLEVYDRIKNTINNTRRFLRNVS